MTDQEQKAQEQFFRNWRSSEFYPFVMEVIDAERKKSYVQDVMTKRVIEGIPMDDNEIAREMRIEVSSNLRIDSIKEVLS